jgi:hypothetical protein
MPVPPPVMTAIFPAKSFMGSLTLPFAILVRMAGARGFEAPTSVMQKRCRSNAPRISYNRADACSSRFPASRQMSALAADYCLFHCKKFPQCPVRIGGRIIMIGCRRCSATPGKVCASASTRSRQPLGHNASLRQQSPIEIARAQTARRSGEISCE